MPAMPKIITFKEAKEKMAKAFRDDPDFRNGYQANIAMLIYDDQRQRGGMHPYPINLNTVEGCNEMADRLLALIFFESGEENISDKIFEEISFKRKGNRFQLMDIDK